MKIVILAEKPSQATSYSKAFNNSNKQEGYIEVSNEYFNGETKITYGFGHLVELFLPEQYDEKYKKWDINNLPIIPSPFKFKIGKGKKTQFNIVKKLLSEADQIIIATDADREGENIAWSIINQSGIDVRDKIIKRLWINSLEVSAIQNGFNNLHDAEQHYSSYIEAQTREFSDWLVGMNASPLYSISLGKQGIKGVFSIGRVQTPTLYMIYKRQMEIEHFKPAPYSELVVHVNTGSSVFNAKLDPLKKFDNREQLNSFLSENKLMLVNDHHNADSNSNLGVIKDVIKDQKKNPSPKLFSLSTLQAKANKSFKASAQNTLDAVQSLYEKKFLTYPRTDSQYITNEEFSYLVEKINEYCAFAHVTSEVTHREPRKRYVDGKKVQEHHAIIPTKTIPTVAQFEKLMPLEKSIYEMVLKTTIAMFLNDLHYNEQIIMIESGLATFKATGRVITNPGWQSLFKSNNKKGQLDSEEFLPNVEVGQEVYVDLVDEDRVTTAPAAYTEGTLITAMKNAGRELSEDQKEVLKETEGIGTEATRASIIERLKDKKYIGLKNNNLIVSTSGTTLCKAVELQPLLTSPELTAQWEMALHDIGQNNRTQQAFLEQIEKFVLKLIEEVPGQISSDQNLATQINSQKEMVAEEKEKLDMGVCPVCKKGHIIDRGKFYGCSNYNSENPCKFSLPAKWSGKTIPKGAIKDLVTKGGTRVIKGFKSKSGKTFSAKLRMLNNKLIFDFDK
ncbi:hypothetical protein IV73_GL001056 [Weissella kandleri]|uniref:DNA topoisomerase n=1 Tax=Weissella kandleri TaxID=1616 RepID=A0A0R2JJ85_9LACO|nr:type IA DNA topoisomerase [Weissella kandleri]KRN74780.1 hypothetical protein IV73_GL001056 [Weissella kandleri]